MFTHNFTSYRMKNVQVETLIVNYDKAGAVSMLTLSKANNSW